MIEKLCTKPPPYYIQIKTCDDSLNLKKSASQNICIRKTTEHDLINRKEMKTEFLNRPSLATLAEVFQNLLEDAVSEMFGVHSRAH